MRLNQNSQPETNSKMPIIKTSLTLKDLPAPPLGKTGWPWTEQTEPLPERMPDGSEYPRISIITPSYNQGEFIEETIRSVLLQGYPNLEYIIIDGGSTDNSVEIIKKYEPWLTYWVSQPDKGQTDAIQQGFNRITGVVWNWLNSDDLLEIGVLERIALAYQAEPLATVYGGEYTIFSDGLLSSVNKKSRCFQNLSELVCVWETWSTPQPAIFLSSSACRAVNGLNLSLHYVMDYELYLRLSQLSGFKVKLLNLTIARARWHPDCKTVKQSICMANEMMQVFDKFACQHPSLLPKQWQRSRSRFNYHLALKTAGKEISLKTFLQVSAPFFRHSIWNYRFFWITLLLYWQPARKLRDFQKNTIKRYSKLTA